MQGKEVIASIDMIVAPKIKGKIVSIDTRTGTFCLEYSRFHSVRREIISIEDANIQVKLSETELKKKKFDLENLQGRDVIVTKLRPRRVKIRGMLVNDETDSMIALFREQRGILQILSPRHGEFYTKSATKKKKKEN